ncbi:MAG: FliO/MopB family protein [Deltaproteobacteria bacterium]|nr:FliO/MopB family protein [Deltaproteobacteria bacterium]
MLLAAASDLSYGWNFAITSIVMIVIIVGAFLVLKYVIPRLTGAQGNSNSKIQILDRQSIAPRKAVYLVQIEDKKVALAISDNHVAKLAEWEVSQ